MKCELQQEKKRKSVLDPDRWVHEYGDVLFRFALHRVGDVATAEDLTQETFLAALQNADRFDDRSTFRTWLVGILRHKIADHFRRAPDPASPRHDDLTTATDALFRESGSWKDMKTSLLRASGATERKELRDVLFACIMKLPPQVAELFVLSEQHQVPAGRLAESVGMSTNALWVRLHRARLALRDCVRRQWFEGGKS